MKKPKKTQKSSGKYSRTVSVNIASKMGSVVKSRLLSALSEKQFTL